MSATNMERDDGSYPNMLTVKKICQVFNIDANWLLFGDDDISNSMKSVKETRTSKFTQWYQYKEKKNSRRPARWYGCPYL